MIRAGLAKVPGLGGKNQLGMGGVFRLLEGGTAKAHVNPDFEVLPDNYYDPQQMRCVKDFLQVVGFYGIWKDLETTYILTPNFLVLVL